MKTFSVTLQFLEPYRLTEDPKNPRGQSFAKWHKSGKPFITGTLLRSAAISAAEELLGMSGGSWDSSNCCSGQFKRDIGTDNSLFWRKRPTRTWKSEVVCSEYENCCPYCALLGRFKADSDKYSIQWGNLFLPDKRTFNKIEDFASQRLLNRVDGHSGRGQDYFRVWEADHEEYPGFVGKVTVNDERALELFKASLRFVDRLCGALCVVNVAGAEETSVVYNKTHPHPVPPLEREGTSSVPVSAKKEAGAVEINNTLKEAAINIVDAFQKKGNLQKARILADVVRALRSKGSSALDTLPEGRDEKGHFLWDTKINGEELRNKIKGLRPTDGKGWRRFCETLGQELYSEYYNKAGTGYAASGVLYENESSSSGEAGTPIFIKAETGIKEWIITGSLKSMTPFFFGTEVREGDHTSFRILTDNEGRYRMPRSALRGILRQDLATAYDTSCNKELGQERPCQCPVCMVMGRITVKDSRSEYKQPPEIRHRNRKNQYTATVADGALFDIEVGPEGIAFPFELRYRGKSLPSELKSVIHHWTDEKAWFGGSGSTGKGRFALGDWNILEWSLNGEGLTKYLQDHGFRNKIPSDHELNNISSTLEKDKLQTYNDYLLPLWTKVGYEIELQAPLLTADPIAALLDKGNRDIIAYKKIKIDDKGKEKPVFAVKGESIRGVFRTAVGKRNRDLEKDHQDCTCSICSIFGNVHETGWVRFEDLEPVLSPPIQGEGQGGDGVAPEYHQKKLDHVSLDRFHAGGKNGAKFDTLPLAGSPSKPIKLQGTLWINSALKDNHRREIALALRDIGDGLFPLGGKTGSGYGMVCKVTLGEDAPKDIRTAFEIEKKVEPGVKTVYSFKDLPKENLNTDHIYYPYYFLKPDKTVNREYKLIGHERFPEKGDSDLVSGRIKCKLNTITPLIIPDTENDDAFGLKAEHNGHKSHHFFRINEEVMIPGSQIRGMVSSVYEAITNSCFRILDEKNYLSWRMKPQLATKFKAGTIKINNKGEMEVVETQTWRLPLYDDVDTTEKAYPDKIDDWKNKVGVNEIRLKKALEANKVIADTAKHNVEYLKAYFKNNPADKKAILSGKKEISFENIYVLVVTKKGKREVIDRIAKLSDSGEKGFIKFTGLNNVNVTNADGEADTAELHWNIRELNITLNTGVEVTPSNIQKYPRAYLECTKVQKKYRLDKRCEKIFAPANGNGKPVPDLVREHYADIIKRYGQNTEKLDENFKTIFQNDTLQEGDHVYFHLDNNENVDAVIPVSISRIYARIPLGKKLHEDLRPCEREWLEDQDMTGIKEFPALEKLYKRHPDGLCPACRMFGTTSYKGRVRFGFASLDGNANWLMPGNECMGGPLTLPLQEKTRPTWAMPADDDNFKVPGRKFYIHHDGWKALLSQPPQGEGQGGDGVKSVEKGENNCTIEPLNAGNEFTFDLFFENLEQWELGLLIYALELQNGLAHKLGRGKAFGFGSVKIDVDKLSILSVNSVEKGKRINWTPSEGKIEEFQKAGLYKLKEWFNKEWDEIEHIKNLQSLLRLRENTRIKAQYATLTSDTEGAIPGYTYQELSDEEKLPLQKRVERLITPMAIWHEKRLAGSVRFFNTERGFGKIKPEKGNDVFVHINGVVDKKPLQAEQKVTFKIRAGRKGPEAYEVEAIQADFNT